MKKKKTLLAPDYSEFVIYGMTAHIKDYTLCWHINQLLELSLRRIFVLEKQISEQIISYPVYYQNEVFEHLQVFLFVNEKHNIFLYPDLKPFQHLLAIAPNPLPSQKEFFYTKMKQSPDILMVQELPADKCNDLLVRTEFLMQRFGKDIYDGE